MLFIRSLTSTAARNVSALKRDAKRLQKHSEGVFGVKYPLKTCQQAVAVSRGFRSLADVERLAHRLGLDKNAPFWTFKGRNDLHQDVLNAICRLELELSENHPVVLTGEQKHSALPALVLFMEEMNQRKIPGLILVETEASCLQDTVLFEQVLGLGFESILDGFRSLDLRESNVPVSISAESRVWTDAVTSALPAELEYALQQSGWTHALSSLSNTVAKEQGGNSLTNTLVCRAAQQLPAQPYGQLSDDTTQDLFLQLSERNCRLGVSAEDESQWRPFVVLFSRNDPVSEVLAAVIHSYFSSRQHRDKKSPVLYFSDTPIAYAPRFLSFGGHTAVANGLNTIPEGDGPGEFYGYKNALKVESNPGSLQCMGKKVSLQGIHLPDF